MANIFLFIFIFTFGAIIGSFLNVIILRLNTGQSIVFGQSKCFSCAKKLKWSELLPIASFVLLKGKCKSCRAKISWQYPIVETITGIIFVLLFQQSQISNLKSQNFLDFGFLVLVFSLLIIIAVYDYRHQIIPNLFVWIFNILAFAGLFFNFGHFDLSGLLAGFVLFAFFVALWGTSRGKWMGFGDAKLALGIGWFLGIAYGVAAITLTFWIGAIAGVLLLCFGKNKYGMKSSIALGPFMVLGTIISFFFGEKIIGFLF